ncbi:MAG TPA: MFS transporter [Gaiellaceae bacterium]|nr:MFS transporter [Gaiellaceae bacterium]
MVHPRHVVAALGSSVRNPDVRRVQLAWGAAIAAEWAHFVALGVFAYEEGGAAAVGVAGLVRLLPAAVLAPFAASLGDRFPRERFLLGLTLVGAVALVGSALAFAADAAFLVFAFAALLGLAVTLIRPALQALLPSLATTPDELIASNAATSTVESLGTLIGPLLAGVLIAVADAGVVFAAGGATLVAGALLLARVRVKGRIELPASADEGGTGAALAAGFRAIARAPRARLVVALIVAQTFVRGCLNVLIVVAAFRVFDAGADAVGYMTAAIGVGGLVGALGALTLGGRRLAVAFGLALVFWGAPIALLAPSPDLLLAVVLLAIVGAANSVEDVAGFTLLQRLVPDQILTRVLGVTWSLAMGGVAIGSIAAPLFVEVLGPRPAFVAVGLILPLLTLLTYRRLGEIDSAVVPGKELELIERVPMFAPLSVAAKERVAARLVPLSVEAGDLVIRAGEVGDRFYIVGAGELDVDAGGTHSVVHEADYFGEIALLRDVPRTATVKALVDTELYALQRDDFLAAVTGHDAAHAAGEAVAEERLARSGRAADHVRTN